MTQEEKDIYEQCVQYDSIESGIQAHAETYSFNIESELFHQFEKATSYIQQHWIWNTKMIKDFVNYMKGE